MAVVDGDSNMESASEASSSCTPSIYTYDSARDAAQFLKEHDGRSFNNLNDTYYLPADEDEFSRLGLQHRVHTRVLRGLYPGVQVVERAIAPEPGVEKAILDVGTGPGHWAIDMARNYPHCKVVGVDLAPRTTAPSLPPNLRLEFDDANLGFPHYHNSFDVVHARSISAGIHDYAAFVADLTNCLRPGGVLILVDAEPPILDENRQLMQLADINGQYPETKGWFARILNEAAKAMSARGGNILKDCTLEILRAMRKTGALDDPVVYTMYIPIGPWPNGISESETTWIKQIGGMMRRNAGEFLGTLKPLLKSQGFTEDVVDKMIEGARAELDTLNPKMYSRWAYGYAVKTGLPVNQVSPSTSSASTSTVTSP